MSVRHALYLTSSLLLFTACPDDPVPEPQEPVANPTPYYPQGGMTVVGPMGGMTSPPAGGTPSTGGTPPTSGVETPTGGTPSTAGVLMPIGATDAGDEAGWEAGSEAGWEAGTELEPCEPGEVLGICEVCGDDGYPMMPEQDIDCPTAICPSESYSINFDGACELLEQVSPELGGYCQDLGSCYEQEEQSCDVVNTEVIAEEGVCATILSCDGTEPPELNTRPNGAFCNTWGTCNNGACSAPFYCEVFNRYNDQNEFCEAGTTENGGQSCTFYVDAGLLTSTGDTTCNDFCANSGTTCIDGWNDINGTCAPNNNNRSCDATLQTQVCVCEVP